MSLSPQEQASLRDKASVSYAAVAATTWLVWDTIIHFDIEVDCIWRSNASWTKIAYIFMRYGTILHEGAVLTLDVGSVSFTTRACKGWLAEEGVFMELLALVVEIVLIMRLYVLFHNNKIVLWSIVLLIIAELSVMSTAIGITVSGALFNESCQILKTPGIFIAYWISSLVFETFLFALTLIAFFQRVKSEYRRHSIIFVFIRDGTWAYALIFVSLLLNTLMYKLETNPLAGMGYYWDCSVLSFAGSHILLNIRRLGIPDHESTAESTLPTAQPRTTGPPVLTSFIDPSSRFESTGAETLPLSEEQGSATLAADYPSCCSACSTQKWEGDSLGAGPSRLTASSRT